MHNIGVRKQNRRQNKMKNKTEKGFYWEGRWTPDPDGSEREPERPENSLTLYEEDGETEAGWM
jgi:hypothetical protein